MRDECLVAFGQCECEGNFNWMLLYLRSGLCLVWDLMFRKVEHVESRCVRTERVAIQPTAAFASVQMNV